jgi:formamidopyrimidine-DNA glycosylase
MPELPDIAAYIDALSARVLHTPLERLRIANPFVVRTISPEPAALAGRTLVTLSRLGKRIVFGFEGELFVVVHLMIAGRLRWRPPGAPLPGRGALAAFDFTPGTILLTEAGARRQASIHIVSGSDALLALDPRGMEILDATREAFAARLTRENHTLKRALTDPHIFSGVGNAYSDEILHAARLSPMKLTGSLNEQEIGALYEAARSVLSLWIARLGEEARHAFPDKVTAFREGMAVHGRYGQPCPTCGSPVQRIVYARNEANYCSRCQTGGRLLSDRALSRLMKDDWPKTLDELEAKRERQTRR